MIQERALQLTLISINWFGDDIKSAFCPGDMAFSCSSRVQWEESSSTIIYRPSYGAQPFFRTLSHMDRFSQSITQSISIHFLPLTVLCPIGREHQSLHAKDHSLSLSSPRGGGSLHLPCWEVVLLSISVEKGFSARRSPEACEKNIGSIQINCRRSKPKGWKTQSTRQTKCQKWVLWNKFQSTRVNHFKFKVKSTSRPN